MQKVEKQNLRVLIDNFWTFGCLLKIRQILEYGRITFQFYMVLRLLLLTQVNSHFIWLSWYETVFNWKFGNYSTPAWRYVTNYLNFTVYWTSGLETRNQFMKNKKMIKLCDLERINSGIQPICSSLCDMLIASFRPTWLNGRSWSIHQISWEREGGGRELVHHWMYQAFHLLNI